MERLDPVSLATRAFTHRCIRVVLMWLLALVLPLQGAAVGVFPVMGPAHVHAPADDSRVLTDFRRWRPSPAPESHVLASLGHFHGAASPQRHHHSYDDGSVVRSGGDDALNSRNSDEGPSASASLAGVLAMLPAAMTLAVPKSPGSLASRPQWTSLTGFIDPPERPPKRG